MSVARKLQIREGERIRIVNAPDGFTLDAQTTRSASADAVLVFVRDRAELSRRVADLIAIARRDGLTWIAYPKAGKLGTDLNRDVLWRLVEPEGVRPVRNVALDETWSALRLRPTG